MDRCPSQPSHGSGVKQLGRGAVWMKDKGEEAEPELRASSERDGGETRARTGNVAADIEELSS